MSKKYTFEMVVVKPTGKGGKPLNPKPIKPTKPIKPVQKSGGGMNDNKPKDPKPKVIPLLPEGVFYKGKAKDYPGVKELIRRKNKKAKGGMTKKQLDILEEVAENPLFSVRQAAKYDKKAYGGELKGGQRKLDKNKDGKISGEDFKLIRREKPEMKPLKAREGKMVKTPDGKKEEDKFSKYVRSIKLPDAKDIRDIVKKKSMGGEMKRGYGAARQSGMGLQDENLQPGKSMDYYKDLI